MENTADLKSRGVLIHSIKEMRCRCRDSNAEAEENMLEERKVMETKKAEGSDIFERYLDLKRLIHLVSWIKRVNRNFCRTDVCNRSQHLNELELQETEESLLKGVQQKKLRLLKSQIY